MYVLCGILSSVSLQESEIPEKQLRRSQGSNSSLVEDSLDKAKEVDGVVRFQELCSFFHSILQTPEKR